MSRMRVKRCRTMDSLQDRKCLPRLVPCCTRACTGPVCTPHCSLKQNIIMCDLLYVIHNLSHLQFRLLSRSINTNVKIKSIILMRRKITHFVQVESHSDFLLNPLRFSFYTCTLLNNFFSNSTQMKIINNWYRIVTTLCQPMSD